MAADPSPVVPSPGLFEDVVGQPAAVEQLAAAARRPVHAYLLHGPPGSGKRAAARALAAALLCPDGGCGRCPTCRRALAGTHPDLVVVERTGASLDVDDARTITARAQRRPLEAARQVLVVPDVHLAARAAPALLKTVEEPPPSTVFVLLADDLPPGLATIVSRCVRIPFGPVPAADVAAWLAAHGVEAELAGTVAAAANGNLERARLLVHDPGFGERQARWRSVPARLDGTGATAVVVASELLAAADGALDPVRREHEQELAALAADAEAQGTRGVPGRKQVEERHRREERRWRTDDLRMGLAALAGAYRDRLAALTGPQTSEGPGPDAERRRVAAHVDAVNAAAGALARNANEPLLLEALLVELSGMLE